MENLIYFNVNISALPLINLFKQKQIKVNIYEKITIQSCFIFKMFIFLY